MRLDNELPVRSGSFRHTFPYKEVKTEIELREQKTVRVEEFSEDLCKYTTLDKGQTLTFSPFLLPFTF